MGSGGGGGGGSATNNNLEASASSGSEKSAGEVTTTSVRGGRSVGSSSSSEFAYTVEQCLQFNSRSPEWTRISKSEKEKLGLTFEDDGEFWYVILSCHNFNKCHGLVNTFEFWMGIF